MSRAEPTAHNGHGGDSGASAVPAVSVQRATMRFGERTLWSELDLDVAPGEFVAVLGPNGSGKTTLLRALLGLQPPTEGRILVAGRPARRGGGDIGYIPQQKSMPEDLPLRGCDLVGLGLDGHRFGLGLGGRRERSRRVQYALEAVGATAYAAAPWAGSPAVQQRLRVAQALVGDPRVLLCDEPLLSLDIAHQRIVTQLIDRRRRDAGTAVLFVTHEINPVLPLVDRVLYLVDGRFRIGRPDEVMTSETLSALYRTAVEVLRVRDRLVVVGAEEAGYQHGPRHAVPLAVSG